MNVKFENLFSERIVEVHVTDAAVLDASALAGLQKKWTSNLLKWHSPYTALLGLGGASIPIEARPDFERLLRMLRGFHMRKIGCWGYALDAETTATAEAIFDKVAPTRDDLLVAMKLDTVLNPREGHIPSLIRVESFFEDQFMEASLTRPAEFRTSDDVAELKKRFEILLRQWHTGYTVVFDCRNFVVDESARNDFESMVRFLKGFFCRAVVGHSGKRGMPYPFPMFSSRHEALEEIAKHREVGSGKSAMNCSRTDLAAVGREGAS